MHYRPLFPSRAAGRRDTETQPLELGAEGERERKGKRKTGRERDRDTERGGERGSVSGERGEEREEGCEREREEGEGERDGRGLLLIRGYSTCAQGELCCSSCHWIMYSVRILSPGQ